MLSLNDTSAIIGEPRLVLTMPLPTPSMVGLYTLDSLQSAFGDFASSQTQLIQYVAGLEIRIAMLESRTWWSMLKAQVKSWFSKRAA